MTLRGLPIAITGASSGIGAATALACAAAGMPVTLGARRVDRLEEVSRQIRQAGGQALVVPVDVRRAEDCRRLIDRTVESFGAVYAVFANAGYGMVGPVLACPEAELRDMFEVNFWGTLHTIRPALEHMLAAGRGHVLICSSCVSKLGLPNAAAYSATKAAQDHIARALREELRGTGVFVSSVHPIGTETEFSAAAKRFGGAQARAARTPRLARQSADTVARAVVRCLARPRGEVWTSTTMRVLMGLGVMFPSLADRVLRRLAAPADPPRP